MIPLVAASSRMPVVQTAIGAIAAIGGGAFGGTFASWFTWQKERQAIAAALAGEVEAVKSVAKFRQYREIIEKCIELTNANNKLVYLTFSVDDHPFPVFEENVSKIGFLPDDLALQVTQFYTFARSAAQDFRTLYSQNLYGWPLPAAVGFLEGMIKVIDVSTDLAEALIPKLRREAARTWKDYLQPN